MRFARAAAAIAVCALFSMASSGCSSALTAPTNGGAAFGQADLTTGTGTPVTNGQSLNVNYTGWLYDSSRAEEKGAQFDASGATPFTFTLGAGSVIKGWDQGIVGMQVGGTRRLVVPGSLAYGSSRHGIIPPNATLVFEVTLVSINATS